MQLECVNAGIKESRKFWNQFESTLMKLPKITNCFIVSDNIEGKQPKNHGIELVSSSDREQTTIANCIIDTVYKYAKWKNCWGVRGTEYHVGETDDAIYEGVPNIRGWEDKLFVEASGLVWRVQHHIGRSGTPYGKQTPLSKAMIQNTLSVACEKEHDADVQLYGHVHYCVGASFPMSRKRAFTLPCLKLQGEAYGRRFNDFYDVGLLLFKQEKEGAPLQEHPLKIKVAYERPKLYKA
jgi:hypothetical protein